MENNPSLIRLGPLLHRLDRVSIVLVLFATLKVCEVVSALCTPNVYQPTMYVILGSTLLSLALLIPAWKGARIALWIIGLYLWVKLLGAIPVLLLTSLDQYWIKFLAVVIGCYSGWGGWVLIRRARKKDQGCDRTTACAVDTP
jgi:hypothetical protein